jgi:imidazole glycerol-phosphate synthase subunit HisF
MLKKRLIPTILVRDGWLVQSMGFNRYLPIGKPKIAIEYFNRWDVDEIVVLDISADRRQTRALLALTSHISKIAFIPLMVGGGIGSVEDIRELLHAGADKVAINTQAVLDPSFIEAAARMFGAQEIVVSIDAKRSEAGWPEVFIDGGKTPTGLGAAQHAQRMERLGAGEILLNSIDRDGSKLGYDVDLIRQVSSAVNIPVIALGGVGSVDEFPRAILEGGADAASAANIFHYIEHSTIQAKAAMRNAGIDVRLSSNVKYETQPFHGAKARL